MHNLAERTGSERNSKASDLVSADTLHGCVMRPPVGYRSAACPFHHRFLQRLSTWSIRIDVLAWLSRSCLSP